MCICICVCARGQCIVSRHVMSCHTRERAAGERCKASVKTPIRSASTKASLLTPATCSVSASILVAGPLPATGSARWAAREAAPDNPPPPPSLGGHGCARGEAWGERGRRPRTREKSCMLMRLRASASCESERERVRGRPGQRSRAVA